ncbi:hypothetical protein [Exiguobacterium sp. JLM-2]|uniref:hypothetical protein n=1 Tax=Exiguobacterium sp. JLM-2 TaxID=1647415 RepID=UPI000649EE8B|nr:hypothetical protein [Exiguobacterium sp. JLM-2]
MEVEMIHSPYKPAEAPHLAQDFILQLSQNPSLVDILNRILTEFEEFSTHIVHGVEEIKNLRYSKLHNTYIYELSVPDQVSGVYKPQIVIKKLRSFDHTYEVRINQEHHKYRFLYQFNKKRPGDQNLIFLSYGFTKSEFKEDLTNSLSDSNDKIKQAFIECNYNEEVIRKWVTIE